jgi:hypothetical protein
MIANHLREKIKKRCHFQHSSTVPQSIARTICVMQKLQMIFLMHFTKFFFKIGHVKQPAMFEVDHNSDDPHGPTDPKFCHN